MSQYTHTTQSEQHEQRLKRMKDDANFQAEIDEKAQQIGEYIKSEYREEFIPAIRGALAALSAKRGRSSAVCGVHALLFGGITDDGNDYDPIDCSEEQLLEVVQYCLELKHKQGIRRAWMICFGDQANNELFM